MENKRFELVPLEEARGFLVKGEIYSVFIAGVVGFTALVWRKSRKPYAVKSGLYFCELGEGKTPPVENVTHVLLNVRDIPRKHTFTALGEGDTRLCIEWPIACKRIPDELMIVTQMVGKFANGGTELLSAPSSIGDQAREDVLNALQRVIDGEDGRIEFVPDGWRLVAEYDLAVDEEKLRLSQEVEGLRIANKELRTLVEDVREVKDGYHAQRDKAYEENEQLRNELAKRPACGSFQQVAAIVRDFMRREAHPHMTLIATQTNVELLEGVKSAPDARKASFEPNLAKGYRSGCSDDVRPLANVGCAPFLLDWLNDPRNFEGAWKVYKENAELTDGQKWVLQNNVERELKRLGTRYLAKGALICRLRDLDEEYGVINPSHLRISQFKSYLSELRAILKEYKERYP